MSKNYIVSKICDKNYPYINKKEDKLNDDEKKDIVIKVCGMLCYKLSNYFIQSTDNIIISAFIGVSAVAYYNNYNLIITYLYVVFANFAVSTVAGVGNLIYTERERLEFVFSKMLIVQQYQFSFASAAFWVLAQFFVQKIFPLTNEIGMPVIILMVLITYIRGDSEVIESIKNAIGEYSDKYYNLAIAVLNVLISFALIKEIGIAGVLIGTLISYIIKEFIVVPHLVFGKVLRGAKRYYLKTFLNIFLSVLIAVLLYALNILFPINTWGMWLLYGVIALVLSISINTLMYHNTKEFTELKEYLLNILRKFSI